MRELIADTLTLVETERILRSNDLILDRLGQHGIEQSELLPLVQSNLSYVNRRCSAVCHYEQERCRRILPILVGTSAGPSLHISFGNPSARVPLDELSTVSVSSIMRTWRAACDKLKAAGFSPRGLAVFELHLLQPLESSALWEPHLHAVLWDVPADAARKAFRVTVPEDINIRRRSTHVQMVNDLPGLLNYMTKFRATVEVQYRAANGSLPWRSNRLTGEQAEAWMLFHSRHTIAQLVTFLGIDGSALRRPMTLELATTQGRSGCRRASFSQRRP